MKFLVRKDIALRGHSKEEPNLPQLLTTWEGDDPVVNCWMEEGKYTSHDIVKELTTLMGQKVLRKVLPRLRVVILAGMLSLVTKQVVSPAQSS